MIAHMVYFSLHNDSDASTEQLVQSCHQHLSGHDGTLFYAAGTRGKGFDRDVNVKDYDVALILVFASKADHDAYQTSDRHVTFIAENRGNWKSVRVFDSEVRKP